MNLISVETGEEISISAVSEDQSGTLVNPTELNMTEVAPDGTTEVVPITDFEHPSVGLYTITRALNQRGTYGYRIVTVEPTSAYEFNATADWSVT